MWCLGPLEGCLIWSSGEHYAPGKWKCWSWMKQMRCLAKVSRSRSTMFIATFLLKPRWTPPPPPLSPKAAFLCALAEAAWVLHLHISILVNREWRPLFQLSCRSPIIFSLRMSEGSQWRGLRQPQTWIQNGPKAYSDPLYLDSTGCTSVSYLTPRGPGDDTQIHDRASAGAREAWWTDFGRHQAVLCGRGEGGVEIWHTLWSLWHPHDYTSCHILQYKAEGKQQPSYNWILPNHVMLGVCLARSKQKPDVPYRQYYCSYLIPSVCSVSYMVYGSYFPTLKHRLHQLKATKFSKVHRQTVRILQMLSFILRGAGWLADWEDEAE